MESRPVDNGSPKFSRLRRAKHSRPVPHGACGTMIVLENYAGIMGLSLVDYKFGFSLKIKGVWFSGWGGKNGE